MKRNNWLMGLVALLLGSGCSNPVVATPLNPPTQTMLPQATTSFTATSSSAIALSAEEAKNLVFELLADNGDCQLPCLWGMTPGDTDRQTLDIFISKFENMITPDIYVSVDDFGDFGGFFLGYRKDNIHINTDFSYYYENKESDRLDLLGIRGYAMHEKGKDLDWLSLDVSPLYGDASFNQIYTYYFLPQILSNYGPPSQVLLKPFLDDPQRADVQWWPFSIVLLYPEQGIFIEYVSRRETVGANFAACPSKSTISLAVWDPQSSLSLEYVVQKAGSQINELNIASFKSVENATSMTLEEFYEVFRDPRNIACVETPQELWQP